MTNKHNQPSKHSEDNPQSSEFDRELKVFLDAPAAADCPSLEHTTNVLSQELSKSWQRFLVMFSVLSVAGFSASLALCAQNAFGLTGFSNHVAMVLHRLPDPWCALACGIIFAAPTAILYALALDRFQWRRLTLGLWWLPLVTTVVACLLMLTAPESLQHEGMIYNHGGGHIMRDRYDQAGWLAAWILGALIPFGFGLWRQARLREQA